MPFSNYSRLTSGQVSSLVSTKERESLTLDYKSKRSLVDNSSSKAELAKDVAAMANTMGGNLIYGVEKDATDTSKPGNIDGWSDSVEVGRLKDWLISVIRTRLSPSLILDAYPVEISGIFVIVVSIPPSVFMPHYCGGKFYHRVGDSTSLILNVEMDESKIRASYANSYSDKFDLQLVTTYNFLYNYRVPTGSDTIAPGYAICFIPFYNLNLGVDARSLLRGLIFNEVGVFRIALQVNGDIFRDSSGFYAKNNDQSQLLQVGRSGTVNLIRRAPNYTDGRNNFNLSDLKSDVQDVLGLAKSLFASQNSDSFGYLMIALFDFQYVRFVDTPNRTFVPINPYRPRSVLPQLREHVIVDSIANVDIETGLDQIIAILKMWCDVN